MRSDRLLLNRRSLLRGAGAALALPLLETMGRAQDKPAKPPVRLAFTYMPHGVIPEQFWPSDPATFTTVPPRILESLSRNRSRSSASTYHSMTCCSMSGWPCSPSC